MGADREENTKFKQKIQGYTKIFVPKGTCIPKKRQKYKNTAKDRMDILCND